MTGDLVSRGKSLRRTIGNIFKFERTLSISPKKSKSWKPSNNDKKQQSNLQLLSQWGKHFAIVACHRCWYFNSFLGYGFHEACLLVNLSNLSHFLFRAFCKTSFWTIYICRDGHQTLIFSVFCAPFAGVCTFSSQFNGRLHRHFCDMKLQL